MNIRHTSTILVAVCCVIIAYGCVKSTTPKPPMEKPGRSAPSLFAESVYQRNLAFLRPLGFHCPEALAAVSVSPCIAIGDFNPGLLIRVCNFLMSFDTFTLRSALEFYVSLSQILPESDLQVIEFHASRIVAILFVLVEGPDRAWLIKELQPLVWSYIALDGIRWPAIVMIDDVPILLGYEWIGSDDSTVVKVAHEVLLGPMRQKPLEPGDKFQAHLDSLCRKIRTELPIIAIVNGGTELAAQHVVDLIQRQATRLCPSGRSDAVWDKDSQSYR